MRNTCIKTEPMTLYLRRISDDYRRKKGIDGSQHDRTIAKVQEFFDSHPDELNDKSQLNLKFYNRFKAWLEDGSGLQVKSILESEKGLRYFCKLINQTEERDGADRIAVESFALSEDNRKKEDRQAKSEPLTEAEVEALWTMNNLTDRETEARDIFIAQCLCGQRISDLPKVFSPDAVISHVNGNDFISLRTQKTDETAVIPILPQLAVLREKYCCGFRFFKLDTTKSKTHINQIGYKINNELKQAENIELDELESRYYYLCGVAPSMALEDNFHLAFEESEGDSIEYSFNGISVKIKNAKRVEFSSDDINWDVEHSDEELYNRCRNWQFAHKVSNGGENTKFK